jgi:hypothetical protein
MVIIYNVFKPGLKSYYNTSIMINVRYLLTPWSRVLLEKLTVNFAASQEIPHNLRY